MENSAGDGSPFAATDGDSFTPDAISDDRRKPQFGILHIMILMAAVGLMLIPSRGFIDGAGGYPENLSGLIIAQWLVHAFISSPPVASLGYWVISRVRRERFPEEPGHWLLIFQGLLSLTHVLYLAVLAAIFHPLSQASDWSNYQFAFAGVTSVIAALVAILILVFRIKKARWKVALGTIAAMNFCYAATYTTIFLLQSNVANWIAWYSIVQIAGSISAFGAYSAVITVAIMDYREGQRDSLHWLGVVCYLLQGAASVVWIILFNLLI